MTLSNIDPEWAWQPFEPTDESWDRAAARHLLRRAGFGGTIAEVDAALEQSPSEVVDQLLVPAEETAEYQSEINAIAQSAIAGGDSKKLSAWWVHRLLTTPNSLLEKMTVFWHGHFATSAAKVTDPRLMFAQNELLRREALGDFNVIVHEMSRDPAMLIWLDSVTNRKAHPNENYAREIMELFCLGEGNYTETDIRELARCFTGWEIKNEKFRFNRYQHDTGEKSMFGSTGDFGGEEAVKIVLKQQSCPEFIVRKLINFFCFDEPTPTPELIAPLAEEFRASGLRIAPIMRRLFTSNLFFSEMSVARKIRSPIEFGIGLLRSLEGSTNVYELTNGLARLGQELFYPPNVKGWDGGRAWINSSTLLGRANLVKRLVDSNKTRFALGPLSDMLASHNMGNEEAALRGLVQHLLARPLADPIQKELVSNTANSPGDKERRLRQGLHLLCSLPEFQVG